MKPPDERPRLLVGRAQAEARLKAQIEKGRELLSEQSSDACKKAYYTWSEYVYELLRSLFSNESLANEFRSFSFGSKPDERFPSAVLKYFREQIGSEPRTDEP
jgi:hypothetical protein